MWVIPFDEQRDKVGKLYADGESSYEGDCAEVEDGTDA
jgi:hypothetical protein